MNAESTLLGIANQQESNSQQLYSLTEPGLQTAENFYEKLASGDPAAIMQAISPAAAQTAQAAAGAKSNIMANSPAGGEKNLALEQVDVNRGAEIAKTATGATLAAPNALGQIAGQGIGESISAAGTGISGLSAGAQALSSLGNLQIEGQQVQAQEKGQQMGMLGGLAGDATMLGVAGKGAGGAGAAKGAGAAAGGAAAGKSGAEIGSEVALAAIAA